MGQPSPSRRRVPQACDRCRVKKGKCDGKKPVCTRCALDGQVCMFSERKFSKDRVIPKGYVELLENRVEVLETGLREALYRLAGTGAVQLRKTVPNAASLRDDNIMIENARDLNFNITAALKELQSMREERESSNTEHDDTTDGLEHSEEESHHDYSDHSMNSGRIDDIATPLTTPANSPPQMGLFLPTDYSQNLLTNMMPAFGSGDLSQQYSDADTAPELMPVLTPGLTYGFDDASSGWLESVTFADLIPQAGNEFRPLTGVN